MSAEQRVLPTELQGPHSELMAIAAELVRGIADEPVIPDTAARYVRKRAIKAVDDANERARLLGIRIAKAIDAFPRVPYERVVYETIANCRAAEKAPERLDVATVPFADYKTFHDALMDIAYGGAYCEASRQAAHTALSRLERLPVGSADRAAEKAPEPSGDAEDAARYRFLRQPGNAIVYAKDRDAWGDDASGHVRYDTPEQLDAAIDRARAAEKAPACASDVCEAAKQDGVVCADDECDRASGVRPEPPAAHDTEQLAWALAAYEVGQTLINEGGGDSLHIRLTRALGILFSEVERLEKLLYPIVRSEKTSEPPAPQAPIARVSVREDGSASATLYAPGLPPGEHDLYAAPAAPYVLATFWRAIIDAYDRAGIVSHKVGIDVTIGAPVIEAARRALKTDGNRRE